MLISRKYQFIFIHIYKNAGTSITYSLLPYAASQWQISINHSLARFGLPKVWAWDPRPYPAHLTAMQLRDKFGKEQYDSLFSFAVIRNPWDWQVSLYNFTLKEENHHQHNLVTNLGTFEEYLHWRCAYDVGFQKDFIYSPQQELLVNFIARFENLENDFGKICEHLGINATLPKLNVSNMRPYQQYYNPETRDLVAKTFAPDIELFGYSFD